MSAEPERRYAEFRVDGDTLTGTVIAYGDEARFGDWRERFEPGSLRHSDVIVNLQHDRARPVARTGAGLALSDGPDALRATITLPDTSYAREARELVNARILRGFSMEFRAVKEEWRDMTRIVTEAELMGFALVDRPAYPESVIAERFEQTRTILGDGPGSVSSRYWY